MTHEAKRWLLKICFAMFVFFGMFAVQSCRRALGTYDVSALQVTRYRYVTNPSDPLVHVVAEVRNEGQQMIEEAVVVAVGIGRNGERRGESRVRIRRIGPGDRRTVATAFKNRGRIATVEVHVEPVPEEEQAK